LGQRWHPFERQVGYGVPALRVRVKAHEGHFAGQRRRHGRAGVAEANDTNGGLHSEILI
jgi:hypothetical protein